MESPSILTSQIHFIWQDVRHESNVLHFKYIINLFQKLFGRFEKFNVFLKVYFKLVLYS